MTDPTYVKDDVVSVKYLLENVTRDLQARDKDDLTPILHGAIGSYRLDFKNIYLQT